MVYAIHPWKGPFKVVKCIGESDYKIKAPPPLEVIHFNPLKPCLAGTRIPILIRTEWCADYRPIPAKRSQLSEHLDILSVVEVPPTAELSTI